ncbi:T9SS type A sorting domain-containing protein [candidate division KSB1 bacterium]|nr:T9SS type A sorting domain-containing protein [candidate division KSB1 bacterium]
MARSFYRNSVKLSILVVFSCSLLSAQAVHVSWSANPEPDVKYYGIFRASSSDSETEIAQVAAAEQEYMDRTIAYGNVYYYRVIAVDSANNVSEFSDPVRILVDIQSSSATAAFPAEFKLEQNHPNPFNPTTTLTYSVAEPAHVSLVIYDVLGRKIRSLVEEHKAPGIHTKIWDARDELGNAVTTGLYFARFVAGSYAETRRLVLEK